MPTFNPSAPVDASFGTVSSNQILTSERVLTQSSNVTLADAGAGSTLTFDLSNTGVTANTYGGLNTSITLGIDAKGRITSASSSAIVFPTTNCYTTVTGTSGSATASGGATLNFTSTNGMTLVAANGSPDSLTVNTPQDLRTSASPSFISVNASPTSDVGTADITLVSIGSDTGLVYQGNPLRLFWSNPDSGSFGGAFVFDDGAENPLPLFVGGLTSTSYISGTSGLFSSATISGLTANRAVYATTGGALSTSSSLTFDGDTLALPNATTSSRGLLIGGGRFYQDTTTSGSGGTLINNKVQFRTANLLINAPTHTSTSANEFALQSTKTFTPTADTTGRIWGFNFTTTCTSAFNFTDATSCIVGVEGSIVNSATGTVAAMSGGIIFNTLGANSNTTRICGIDVYGADVSGSGGVGGTVGEAANYIARMGRSSGNTSLGNITNFWGFQMRASTWSGTGHMTNQIGVGYGSGHTMNSLTANNQSRKMFVVPAMPSAGAFTGTTIYGIDFLGTSRATRDGIRIAGDVEIYSSAANVLSLGSGDSYLSDTSMLSPLFTRTNTGTTTFTGWVATGTANGGDALFKAGSGSGLTGNGGAVKIYGGAKSGAGTDGSWACYKVDGTTKLIEGNQTGLGFFATTPAAQDTGWSVTNVTTDKSFDANSTTLDEVADALGTLINQLKTYGLLAA